MMSSKVIGFALLASVSLVSAVASAEGDDKAVSVVSGQFTDKVEGGKPVGDAASLAGARTATYWVAVKNDGDPTALTVVWKADGAEIARQSMDVGHAPKWRTWATSATKGASVLEVEILGPGGASLHKDSVTLKK